MGTVAQIRNSVESTQDQSSPRSACFSRHSSERLRQDRHALQEGGFPNGGRLKERQGGRSFRWFACVARLLPPERTSQMNIYVRLGENDGLPL